ncbi:hypothetical protein K0B96_17055 [Horticoccus luteus]|uniref:L-alanine-DL-glutamate epimerase-like enolase superfamily enzyme n=1 Tax=Horticoccus luteus TaxID=2862869 RepID=A0A8F9TTJ4_9BACT|nr:hypothetical protein [Horticoccus luteus]QYM78989.1 hypothetical protein K0B96_17055 [Horticoccus luteus]
MITLSKARLAEQPLRARMPFRYGIATMTEVTHVILELTFTIDGKEWLGLAADHLPPKWFTKDPRRALDEEVSEMRRVIVAAVTHARTVAAPTPFQFWRELYARQAAWGSAENIPPLLAQFGATLVERALIDAFCRAGGLNFAAAVRTNALGVDLGAVHPSLAGSAPGDWLPAAPRTRVFARHTVGLSDPLEADELPAAERAHDGLPQTLEECVRFYGLRHFKLKINGEAARDRARLAKMARIFARECGGDFAFSLDGNESFHEVAAFADYARGLMADEALASLWPKLLFIEQPWHRDVALSDAIGELTRAWPERPPIIIDESDAEIGSLPRALALGYAGTSHKNCKGVFKGIANACLLAQRRKRGEPGMLSGEDLSNVGPVALLQDLAVQTVLGVESVERNGHHYFAGLAQFPAAVQAHIRAHHSDLYTQTEGGWPRVDVREGQIELGSVLAAPFGCAPGMDLSSLKTTALE